MAYQVSRRSFLKGAAALAVATAASGLLTGCGGGKNDSGFTLKGDDYKVYFSDSEWGTIENSNYYMQMNLKMERITKVLNPLPSSTKYSEIFSAKIGDADAGIKLTNGDETVKKLSKNDSVVCVPRFVTDNKTLFDKATNGEELVYLTIKMGGDSTVFEINLKTKTIKYKVR